ncbi:MAG: FAD-dependent oxidoreductase [Solirubrobacteraceae bacterium]|nr:FAD-dependent oxidoreductase [Solirubrobacteraceae bacterium]
MRRSSRTVVVIGSGVSGLTAAYVAARHARVTLIEADDRLGGHADTHDVTVGPPGRRRTVPIDTGFIVHNDRTYPTLRRLFAELDVATRPSEMSLSVRCDETGIEWAGARGVRGLFPTPATRRPSHVRALAELPRLHRMARRTLEAPEGDGPPETLGAFLDRGRFSDRFRTHVMAPLVAAVWSCEPDRALEYPARHLFAFLQHHGMLQVLGSPTWRTVVGGSRTYVDRVAAAIVAAGGEVRTGSPVAALTEDADGVVVTTADGAVSRFDAAVVAAHPGQALAFLRDPTPVQREVLGAIPYARNVALLHTDTSVLPRSPHARASWNHLRRPAGTAPPDGALTVTYDLTRLMRIPRVADGVDLGDRRFLVTLGGGDLVDLATVIDEMPYEHPRYTVESVAAQRRQAECDTARIAFAGAWGGWGFHEDGARSGARAAERLGLTWDAPVVPAHRPAADRGLAPGAIYRTTLHHRRRTPRPNAFEARSHLWVVDVDDLPDHGRAALWRGSFQARDHLGDPHGTIRGNVDRFLAAHDVTLADAHGPGRVLMATLPRAWGFCFNPISVFWCERGDGTRAAVVVEVHNTYGDRHAYLVRPDADDRARTDKAMYVSPFHDAVGGYELWVPTPTAERVAFSVRLRSDEHGAPATFDATLTGAPTDATPARAATAALRGALLIRVHGIALWARGHRRFDRPTHDPQEHVQ